MSEALKAAVRKVKCKTSQRYIFHVYQWRSFVVSFSLMTHYCSVTFLSCECVRLCVLSVTACLASCLCVCLSHASLRSLLGSECWDETQGEEHEPRVWTAERWYHHKRGGFRQGAPGVPAHREREGMSQGNSFYSQLPCLALFLLFIYMFNVNMPSQCPEEA